MLVCLNGDPSIRLSLLRTHPETFLYFLLSCPNGAIVSLINSVVFVFHRIRNHVFTDIVIETVMEHLCEYMYISTD